MDETNIYDFQDIQLYIHTIILRLIQVLKWMKGGKEIIMII